MKKTTKIPATQKYLGGCHCGAVRFEAELDLTQPASRCNCSMCTKSGATGMVATPARFELLQGMDSLSDYQFNSKSVHHLFCKQCGIRSFSRGNIPELGGEFYSVNVACLDDVDLDALALVYWDGKHNAWDKGPIRTTPPVAA